MFIPSYSQIFFPVNNSQQPIGVPSSHFQWLKFLPRLCFRLFQNKGLFFSGRKYYHFITQKRMQNSIFKSPSRECGEGATIGMEYTWVGRRSGRGGGGGKAHSRLGGSGGGGGYSSYFHLSGGRTGARGRSVSSHHHSPIQCDTTELSYIHSKWTLSYTSSKKVWISFYKNTCIISTVIPWRYFVTNMYCITDILYLYLIFSVCAWTQSDMWGGGGE